MMVEDLWLKGESNSRSCALERTSFQNNGYREGRLKGNEIRST
jgi:hypothetical protein